MGLVGVVDGGEGRGEGLHAWVLEIHWWEGSAADFLGLAWVRVEEVLFDGAEELMLDRDVSVVVVGFCFAADGLKLVRTERCAC